jgi:uncharacterized membrane protein
MSTRITNILIIIILVGSVVAGAFLWNRLPDPMASHWGINDQVNGTMPKFWGIFLMPIISLGMFLLFMLVPNIDPLKANIAQFRETFNVFILLIFLFLAYVWKLSIAWNLGFTNFKMSTSMLPAMGLLFIFVGYLLRKAKRNFFIGIRTPWTLSSDSVWDKTHQLGSILFFACGVLALMGSLFGGQAAFLLMFIPVMGSALFLVVYSYVLYRQETKA